MRISIPLLLVCIGVGSYVNIRIGLAEHFVSRHNRSFASFSLSFLTQQSFPLLHKATYTGVVVHPFCSWHIPSLCLLFLLCVTLLRPSVLWKEKAYNRFFDRLCFFRDSRRLEFTFFRAWLVSGFLKPSPNSFLFRHANWYAQRGSKPLIEGRCPSHRGPNFWKLTFFKFLGH